MYIKRTQKSVFCKREWLKIWMNRTDLCEYENYIPWREKSKLGRSL